MKNNIFSFSFDKKPDPRQWTELKYKLSPTYTLPDTEMLSNLHRCSVPIPTILVHDWLKNDTQILNQEEDDLNKKIVHLLPEHYVIPDVIRLKNIFIK